MCAGILAGWAGQSVTRVPYPYPYLFVRRPRWLLRLVVIVIVECMHAYAYTLLLNYAHAHGRVTHSYIPTRLHIYTYMHTSLLFVSLLNYYRYYYYYYYYFFFLSPLFFSNFHCNFLWFFRWTLTPRPCVSSPFPLLPVFFLPSFSYLVSFCLISFHILTYFPLS